MLLESISSTSKRAEELLNSINDRSIGSNGPILIEEHFSAFVLCGFPSALTLERAFANNNLVELDELNDRDCRHPRILQPQASVESVVDFPVQKGLMILIVLGFILQEYNWVYLQRNTTFKSIQECVMGQLQFVQWLP